MLVRGSIWQRIWQIVRPWSYTRIDARQFFPYLLDIDGDKVILGRQAGRATVSKAGKDEQIAAKGLFISFASWVPSDVVGLG